MVTVNANDWELTIDVCDIPGLNPVSGLMDPFGRVGIGFIGLTRADPESYDCNNYIITHHALIPESFWEYLRREANDEDVTFPDNITPQDDFTYCIFPVVNLSDGFYARYGNRYNCALACIVDEFKPVTREIRAHIVLTYAGAPAFERMGHALRNYLKPTTFCLAVDTAWLKYRRESRLSNADPDSFSAPKSLRIIKVD